MSDGLRIVTFNVLPPAYQMVAGWAQQMGHQLVLVVTTPGPSTRRTPTYREIVATAPAGQDVLVTTRLRRVAAPLIRELKPDLVVSMTFPYRIPPEITSIPRYGAVNLHPAPLPYYRGPNPLRGIYENFPTIGATLHRTEEDFRYGRDFQFEVCATAQTDDAGSGYGSMDSIDDRSVRRRDCAHVGG